jgi:predicted transcriptional regulator
LPILKQKKYLSSEIKRVVNQLFSGNAGELVLNLVKNERLSKQDIADLKRLLKE